MRALLISPRSIPSFWSLPGVMRLTGKKALSPPLGLATVAALLPQDWSLRLVDQEVSRLSEADWAFAELVLVTGNLQHAPGQGRVVAEAKARGKKVVVGGPYANSLPEEAGASGADFLVLGEAEATLPSLLEALAKGKSSGVIDSPEKPDLSLSPAPRFDLLSLPDYFYAGVQTTRGCPHDCEFCDVVRSYGRRLRVKTPTQVLAELELLHRLGWRGGIFIDDDNFIGPRGQAKALLEALIPWHKARGEPFSFTTQAALDLAEDDDLIDLMTLANFGAVVVGVETPRADLLARAGKWQNLGRPLVERLAHLNRRGLHVVATTILGFDGEEAGIEEELGALMEAANLPLVMVNLLRAYPRTRLWTRLAQEGRISDRPSSRDLLADLNFVTDRPREEITAGFNRVLQDLYRPEAYLARAFRAALAMRPTRKALGLKEPSYPTLPGPPSARPSRRERVESWTRRMGFFWRHGLKTPHRVQFWRQLLGIARRNPSRLYRYLDDVCLMDDFAFFQGYHSLVLETTGGDLNAGR